MSFGKVASGAWYEGRLVRLPLFVGSKSERIGWKLNFTTPIAIGDEKIVSVILEVRESAGSNVKNNLTLAENMRVRVFAVFDRIRGYHRLTIDSEILTKDTVDNPVIPISSGTTERG